MIIAYDSDAAGQAATQKAMRHFSEVGIETKILRMQGAKDPDEYIKSFGKDGPLKFKQLIEKSENDILYLLDKIKKDKNLGTPEGKIEYLNEASKILVGLNNRMEREIYASKLSEEIGIEKHSIMLQVDKLLKKKYKINNKKQFNALRQNTIARKDNINPEKFDNLRAANAEEALISYLINNPEDVKYVYSKLKPEKFSTSFNREIYEVILKKYSENKNISLTDLSIEFSIDEISRIAKMLSNYIKPNNPKITVNEYIDVILYENSKIDSKKIIDANLDDIKNFMKVLKDKKK